MLLFLCGISPARPTTDDQAQKVVTGWLKTAAQTFYPELEQNVAEIETFFAESGEPIYYVVYLQSGGFVIVSANDMVEPIIAFSDSDTYDPSDVNPLGALVNGDINNRMATVQGTFGLQMAVRNSAVLNTQNKWRYFQNLAEQDGSGFALMGQISISDIRVPPLIQSRWGQTGCCTNPALECFNYYTPGQYPCGCVATAMAQLIRFHRYPVSPIGANRIVIEFDRKLQTASTRGGDGSGGAYDFSAMPTDPNCNTAEAGRKAIGALCYDAGISVGTNYGSDMSSAEVYLTKDALTTIFQYGNAVNGYNSNENIGPGLIEMINPNLDAGSPVILAVKRQGGGHAVLCDGYGYIFSTLYHHLNMGWAGLDDAWYNLPTIDTDRYEYTSINECIYNIRVTQVGDGEVISGRVFDIYNRPISDAVIYVESIDGDSSFTARSNEKGIYAFDGLNSNTTYTIRPKSGTFIFAGRTVTTGESLNDRPVSGNVWGVDFTAVYIGDFDGDSDIDSADFAVLASTWQTISGDTQYNPDCDISNPPDKTIDALDLAVFVDNWLAVAE